jgi:hypothetical protein
VHLERVRALEGVLQEQEVIKREVGVLRNLVEGRRPAGAAETQHHHDRAQKEREEQELEGLRYDPDELELLARPHDVEEEEDGEEDDDMDDDDEDDRRSVGTVMAHELARVDEEDEEEMAEEERRAREHERDQDDGAADAHRPVDSEDRFRPPLPAPEPEEQSAFEHDAPQRGEDGAPEDEGEDDEETQQEIEEQERRRAEDLGVGRPRTPEPSLLGLGMGLGAERRERRTGGSPLSGTAAAGAADIKGAPPAMTAATATTNTAMTTAMTTTTNATEPTTEDVHAQVERLAAQVGAVLALTTTLEKQHASAQFTIRELEEKVRSLEGLLATTSTSSLPPPASTTADAIDQSADATTHVDADVSLDPEPTPIDVEGPSAEEATDAAAGPADATPSALSAWTRSIAGQWSTLQADWARERTSLARAKEDWDARAARLDGGLTRLDAGLARLDAGLAKADGAHGAVAGLLAAQERVRDAVREQGGRLEAHVAAYHAHLQTGGLPLGEGERWGAGANGDALKHSRRGGLVTPPSPRSQSSDSARYRRRRRRSSGSRPGSSRGARSEEESEGEDADEDHGKHSIGRALGLATATAVSGAGALATPESSVYKFSGTSKGGDDSGPDMDTTHAGSTMHTGVLTAPETRANSHAQSPLDATPEAASLPLLGLSLWTLLLILSFSFAAIAFSVSVLHVLFVRLRAWVALRIQGALVDSSPVAEGREEELKGKARGHPHLGPPMLNMQAAFGVVVLSIAAAAVIWKIRPAD